MTAKLLSENELITIQQSLPEWKLQSRKLCREWTFKDFVEAFGFISKVALLSQEMNHHPELKNVYSSVRIELTTHDLGGLSNLDIQLARAIDSL